MGKSILIIDDEVIVTKSLASLLKKRGYEVSAAQNAIEAVEKVKQTDFDLIVSDIRMPQVDGIEAIMKIRKYLSENKKKPIPEVLITGYANEESYRKALELKVADYIFKPFDSDVFLEVVEKNIKNQQGGISETNFN